MTDALVLRADFGPVALLRLNRPARRNALSRALVTQLADRLGEVAADPAIRAVVLTGEGPVFCSGMDLREAEQAGRGTDAERTAVVEVRALADLFDQIHDSTRPIVAAVQGDAMAGGAGLALACDFVFAATDVRFGYPEVLRGLVPAIVMRDLIQQVGERRARYLLLSGQPIEAEEALGWGLVNRLISRDRLLDECIRFAAGLALAGPQAIASTKRLIDETGGRPRDLRGAAAITAAVRVSDEATEGLRAFLERRPPRWAPRIDPGDPTA